MDASLKAHLINAHSKRKENKKFLLSLSKKKNLDEVFHAQHQEVFSHTDCLQCANCCKTTSPIFRDVDVERISKHLGIRPADFTKKFLHLDDENDWVLNSAPCVFLDEKNYCIIYNVRPKACRDYPHTDRKNMSQILDLTYRNTLVCPAVGEMVERMKKDVTM
ncbi:MAG: YkgJ family cysteine cluster protein [Flavobacteriales bacterium]|nr:YkgJ family cysteine cluster protein [Flavobacteriales bacterium]